MGLNTKSVDRNGSIFNATYNGLYQMRETVQVSADHKKSIGYRYCYQSPYGPSDQQLFINGQFVTQNHLKYNVHGAISQKNVLGSNYINSNLILQYDDSVRLKTQGVGVQNRDYFYTNYKYTNNRLTKVQTNGSQTVSSSDFHNATYEYNPNGSLKKITYPKLNDNSLLTTEYFYNAIGRMTTMVNKKGNTVLSQFTYTYDANGNILSVNDGETTKSYSYDKLNRLIEVKQPGNTIKYTYDLRGNRLVENNSNNLIPLISTASYAYTLENKLESVTKNSVKTTMKYYVDGLRASKETGSSISSYIYNLSGKVIAEAKNSNKITANYVWGPDRALVKKEVGGGEYYYLYNGHGDVVLA